MRRHILVSLASMITLCISVLTLHAQEIKINEILYDPTGGDTGREWIELYNESTEPIQLEGWQIQKAGTSFDECLTFPEYIIYPGEYLLIGESQIPNADLIGVLAFQNGGTATDGVRIISAEGDTIDTILYDFPNSNNLPGDANHPGIFFAPDVSSGYSLMRFPDGFDTDNCENDFFDCENPTPGYSNTVNSNIHGTITLYGDTGNVENVEVTADGFTVNPNATGYYIISITSGTYDVTASLEGYIDSTITGVEVFEGQSTAGIDFILYSSEKPDIFIDPDSLAFGNVTIGEVSTIKNFYIFNQGNVDLDIYEISTPYGFEIKKGDAGDWVTNISNFTILDSSFQKIYVRFIPTDTVSYSSDISICSNDPYEDTVYVNVSGKGVEHAAPNVEINPAEILFGSVTFLTSKEEYFNISNTGSAELIIDSISVPVNSVFMIRIGYSGEYSHFISGFSISVGNEQDIYVKFTPPEIGQYSTYISIKSNVGSNSVYISGNGVEYVVPDIDVNPVELYFGDVSIYHSMYDTITIMNTGNAILEINKIFSLSGYEIKLDDGIWSNDIPAFDIPPLEEEIIYVKFHPEALITYNGFIYITSNDPDEGSIPVLVEGQGIPVLSEKTPDAFTPNGDGLNDEFIIGPFKEAGSEKAKFKVFDLHGKLIHETKGAANEPLFWNGIDNSGNKSSSGAYIYVYLINNAVYKSGKIYLVR